MPGRVRISWIAAVVASYAASAWAGRVYLPDPARSAILVADDSSGAIVRMLPTSKPSRNVVLRSDGQRLFIANTGWIVGSDADEEEGTVTVLDRIPVTTASSTDGFVDDEYRYEGGITVGSHPFDLALDETRGRLYVSNAGSDSVSIVDASTLAVVGEVSVPLMPTGIAVDNRSGDLFVTQRYGAQVVRIAPSEARIVAAEGVGDVPLDVVVSSDGSKVYVASTGSNEVAVLDGGSLKMVARVPVPAGPVRLEISKDDKEVYIASMLAGKLSVLDTQTSQVSASIDAGGAPTSLAVSVDTQDPWLGTFLRADVRIVDRATRQVVKLIPHAFSDVGGGER